MIGDEKRGWYENGKYTGRWTTESAYIAMAKRMYAGAATGGSPSTAPASVTATERAKGEAIWGQLRTQASSKTSALRGLWGKGMGVMDRIGRWGPLKAFGTVSLGVAAAEVGWSIGGKISDLFNPGQGSETPTGPTELTAWKMEPIGAGEEYGGYKATSFGWIVLFEEKGSERGSGVLKVPAPCPAWVYRKVPPEAVFKQTVTFPTTCSGETKTVIGGVYYVPLHVTHLPPLGTGPGGTKTTSPPTPKSDAVAEDIVQEKVLENPEEDDLSGWWWNHDPDVQAATVVEGGEVDVDPADPLQVRVPAPLPGETYTAYGERLEALGLVPEPIALPDYATDPAKGPLEVVQVNPKPGKNVEDGATVKVRYNPATAPEASAPPAPGSCSAAVDAIDIEPLGVPLSENFPFGIPGWMLGTLSGWAETSEPPVWELTLGNGIEWTIDFGFLDSFIDVIRIAVVLVSGLGFVFFLAAAATKTESGISSE